MARRSKHRLTNLLGKPMQGRIKWMPVIATPHVRGVYALFALNADTGNVEVVGHSGQLATALSVGHIVGRPDRFAFANGLTLPGSLIEAAGRLRMSLAHVTVINYYLMPRGLDKAGIDQQLETIADQYNRVSAQAMENTSALWKAPAGVERGTVEHVEVGESE